jgi:tetraacyldisaccharide 4'-kinase
VFQVYFRPTRLIQIITGQTLDPSALKGKAVFAFSGIGQPATFRFFLEQLGGNIIDEVVFPDHHGYDEVEVRRLIRSAKDRDADYLVTTEKDAVKVQEYIKSGDSIWTLRVDPVQIEDKRTWEQFLLDHVKIHQT